MNEERIKWILEQHKNTNHYYDKYLPYEFHLRMVVQVFEDSAWVLNCTCSQEVDAQAQMSRLIDWGIAPENIRVVYE